MSKAEFVTGLTAYLEKHNVGQDSTASDPGFSADSGPGAGRSFQSQVTVCPYCGRCPGCGRPVEVAPYLPQPYWGRHPWELPMSEGMITDNSLFDGHTIMVFNG